MIDDPTLLEVWDRGNGRGALDRALLLAAAAGVDASMVADLPVDARDRRVLAFGAALGGDAMPVVLTCAQCDAAMDVTLSAASLAATGEVVVGVRAPSSRDLADALALADDRDRRRLLAERAAGVDPATLDDDAVDAIEARLEAASGPEDIALSYCCPTCAATGEAEFDAAAYIWALLARRGRDVTATVADLARAYGWTEATVLALSPERRARYRELAG